MLEEQKVDAQHILEELYSEGVLNFKLFACQVEFIGGKEYTVRFHDSRLRSVDVSWDENQSFSEVFRNAVLERMGRIEAIRH